MTPLPPTSCEICRPVRTCLKFKIRYKTVLAKWLAPKYHTRDFKSHKPVGPENPDHSLWYQIFLDVSFEAYNKVWILPDWCGCAPLYPQNQCTRTNHTVLCYSFSIDTTTSEAWQRKLCRTTLKI